MTTQILRRRPPDEREHAAVDYVEGLRGILPEALSEGGWLDFSQELLGLVTSSARATVGHGKRVVSVLDLQLAVDVADADRIGARGREESDLCKL